MKLNQSSEASFTTVIDFFAMNDIVSGYVCNHGSPIGERDTASPRGRYGGTPSA